MRKTEWKIIAALLGTAVAAVPSAADMPKGSAVTATAAAPGGPTQAADPAQAHDYIAEARWLSVVAGCAQGALPANVSARLVQQHCTALTPALTAYKQQWLQAAVPFFAQVVPPDLPRTVVYPFGGADLLAALAVFPQADEITSISLEPAGDPRWVTALDERAAARALDVVRADLVHMFRTTHSRTLTMIETMRYGNLPTLLAFSLVALEIHGYEPVSLRYFRLGEDGAIQYLADTAGAPGLKAPVGQRNRFFANMELRFQKRGATEPVRVFRHIQANLADKELAQDGRILRHLESKGPVSAMTKAASHLLWFEHFIQIRDYLLDHAVWMVSDATGVQPKAARAKGYEIETWGSFRGALIGSPGKFLVKEMTDLWAQQPPRPIKFLFGYPDKAGHGHVMVIRRSAAASQVPASR